MDELNCLCAAESGPEEKRNADREEPPRIRLCGTRGVADRIGDRPRNASALNCVLGTVAFVRPSPPPTIKPNGSNQRNNLYANPPASTLAATRSISFGRPNWDQRSRCAAPFRPSLPAVAGPSTGSCRPEGCQQPLKVMSPPRRAALSARGLWSHRSARSPSVAPCHAGVARTSGRIGRPAEQR